MRGPRIFALAALIAIPMAGTTSASAAPAGASVGKAGAAIGAPGLFELRPLAPRSAAVPGRIVAGALALFLWAFAMIGAWRQTRES